MDTLLESKDCFLGAAARACPSPPPWNLLLCSEQLLRPLQRSILFLSPFSLARPLRPNPGPAQAMEPSSGTEAARKAWNESWVLSVSHQMDAVGLALAALSPLRDSTGNPDVRRCFLQATCAILELLMAALPRVHAAGYIRADWVELFVQQAEVATRGAGQARLPGSGGPPPALTQGGPDTPAEEFALPVFVEIVRNSFLGSGQPPQPTGGGGGGAQQQGNHLQWGLGL